MQANTAEALLRSIVQAREENVGPQSPELAWALIGLARWVPQVTMNFTIWL